MLYWNVLKQNLDVERVDVILGHNVEYTGSMSRLPILELEGSKGSHLERGPCQTEEKFSFLQGRNVNEMDWNSHGGIQIPCPTISSGIHSPGPPAPWVSMQKPCDLVERLLGSVKQQKESDRVRLGQVNKTHRLQSGNLDVDCHLCSCWGWSGPQSAGVRIAFSRYWSQR